MNRIGKWAAAFLAVCSIVLLSGSRLTAVQAGTSTDHFLPLITNSSALNAGAGWSMAGGNPQRTSWTPNSVPGNLKPAWYRPIEAYIPQKVQIIADMGMLFISTANGLYALDAETGAERWTYATAMPLGHSPTIANGVAYVGGFDKKIHAINATTGKGIWTFEAEAGFQTNPVVQNNTVYMGSRDGYFYAVNATNGTLRWKYKTDGPILFSAAYSDNALYFASNDSHAYALNATNGDLIWKSDKLPGSGFNSFWPVVYRDRVIFNASPNYRNGGPAIAEPRDYLAILPNAKKDPRGMLIGEFGQEPGDWVAGTPTIDMSKSVTTPNGSTVAVTEFFETYPWRRTVFVLDQATGAEYSYDFDGDGRPEYAPIAHAGVYNGTTSPPVVGSDGVLYFQNWYMSDSVIPGGHISGWKLDTPYISVISQDWAARDENHVFLAAGDHIYWNLCCDRQAGSIDISKPNVKFIENVNNNILPPTKGINAGREESYIGYNLPSVIPGYNIMTHVWSPYYKPQGGVYGGRNGAYGWHHDGNPPVPYNGKVYLHGSNAIIAFDAETDTPTQLPLLPIKPASSADVPVVSKTEMQAMLVDEIQKMVDAGHLRPGYFTGAGLFDFPAITHCGDRLVDYFHNPGETIVTLLRALPHLPAGMQPDVRAYIQSEYNAYPPYQYTHIGWNSGTHRTQFDIPDDALDSLNGFGPTSKVNGFDGWTFNPYGVYAVWKYAETFGDAATQLSNVKASKNLMESLNNVPSNAVLAEIPSVHNAYIAGLTGYINLAQLAGSSENLSAKQATLDSLLALRAATFSNDAPDIYFGGGSIQYYNCRAMNNARNFLFITPELGDYLRANALAKVDSALDEIEYLAPFWFVAAPETGYGEGVRQNLHDYYAIYQAKALIMNAPHSELGQFIDVPAFPVGDLYFISNLAAGLEAE